MAEEDLELADDEESGGGKGKLFLIIGIVVGLLVIGGGAGMYFLGVFDGDEVTAEGGEGEAGDDEAEEAKKPAIYVPIGKNFTVNLQSSGKRGKFLQLSLEVLVRDAALEEALKNHTPALRSQLTMLFSSKTAKQLSSMNGKKKLQKEALNTIQDTIKDAEGLDGIESVLFTSFVMQ